MSPSTPLSISTDGSPFTSFADAAPDLSMTSTSTSGASSAAHPTPSPVTPIYPSSVPQQSPLQHKQQLQPQSTMQAQQLTASSPSGKFTLSARPPAAPPLQLFGAAQSCMLPVSRLTSEQRAFPNGPHGGPAYHRGLGTRAGQGRVTGASKYVRQGGWLQRQMLQQQQQLQQDHQKQQQQQQQQYLEREQILAD